MLHALGGLASRQADACQETGVLSSYQSARRSTFGKSSHLPKGQSIPQVHTFCDLIFSAALYPGQVDRVDTNLRWNLLGMLLLISEVLPVPLA
jgi:hypothetical protein